MPADTTRSTDVRSDTTSRATTSAPSSWRVSVLMPVRNEERHVVAAVTSVLTQSHPPYEVLVIDALSTDRTVELVRQLGDHRVRVLTNPQRTIPAALNVGLRAARGDVIARVDAHARVNADYLRIGLRHLQDQEVAAVGGIRIAIAETATGQAVAAALSSPFGVGNSINHYASEAQDTDHASFGVYRADVAREVGGWDETLLVNEDVDFDHRIAAIGYRIRFDPDMRILWQVRETLRDFARQYRRYGRGKAAMVRKNGRSAVRVRHLTAPALVSVLGLAGAAALTGRAKVATVLVAPYAVALSAATVHTRNKVKAVNAPLVLGSFATMHVTWGLGFLEGLLLGKLPASATSRDPDSAS